MESVLTIYKQRGETPLESLEKLRRDRGISDAVPMTYAGRLDPMAEGLLLILTGEECKKKEAYLALEKEYLVDVLFGVSTDTGDCLGVIKKVANKKVVFEKGCLKKYLGKKEQQYPMYSSRTVEGLPLFAWARKGIAKIFKKKVEIFDVAYIKEESVTAENLLTKVLEDIELVSGDFRQEEIGRAWEKSLSGEKVSFLVVTIQVACSSGTYMRVLAEEIGIDMGVPALALRIKRTKIGNYSI